MSSKRKQKTLAAFGFTKKVKHRSEETNITLPEEGDLEDHFQAELSAVLPKVQEPARIEPAYDL